MSPHDTRPAHERLDGFAVKHLHKILAVLRGGSIGFDAFRDDRTDSKDKLCAFIRNNYSSAEIDAAHSAACASYGDGGKAFASRRGSRRGSRRNDAAADTSSAATSTPPTATPPTVSTPPTSDNGNAAVELAELIRRLSSATVDESKVRAIVGEVVADLIKSLESRISESAAKSGGVVTVEVKRPDLPTVNVGIQHKQFPLLLQTCNARTDDGNRLNAWLAGPAGTGKTTAAKNAAKALGLEFRFNGAIDSPYKLTGFTDANGRTIRTPFRESWEHGGVYLFDEVDASSPGAILEFNAALANGVAAFPDTIVSRHPDCIVIAGANTTGLGASLEYVGRMKQDAAFLDRFVIIDWQLDEALESALCGNAAWVARVRKVRSSVKSRGVKGALISPRATVYGAALLAAGIDQQTVEAMTLRKGMDSATWESVK